MSNEETKEVVAEMFTEYLRSGKRRRTPERFAILDEIYSREGHFSIESLYIFMQSKNYRVSRATLYNTVDLLLDCKLVVKHQFGEKNVQQFEKAYNTKNHDHLICTSCGKVSEFYDRRLVAVKRNVSDKMNFQVTHHSLYVYGKCEECVKLQKTNNSLQHKIKKTKTK